MQRQGGGRDYWCLCGCSSDLLVGCTARPPGVKPRGEALTTCHHLAFAKADQLASHAVLHCSLCGGSARPSPPGKLTTITDAAAWRRCWHRTDHGTTASGSGQRHSEADPCSIEPLMRANDLTGSFDSYVLEDDGTTPGPATGAQRILR